MKKFDSKNTMICEDNLQATETVFLADRIVPAEFLARHL